MGLTLETYVARLPELGGSSRDAFALVEVLGLREGRSSVPYRDRGGPSLSRAPLCLAIAIDASSSMRGSRFGLAVQATRDIVASLGPEDRLTVVTFDRGARVALGPIAPDADGLATALKALDRLSTGIGTNLGAAWQESADSVLRTVMPGAERRILLLTDGYPSRGETSPEALRARVAEGRARGVETTLVGIGDGIDERLCAALASAGEGRFHYVRDEGGLGEVVAREVEGATAVCAQNVVVSLNLGVGVQRAEVLHRYPCKPDGRSLEVRVGTITWESPRAVLLGLVADESPELVLGVASAQGARVGQERSPAATTALGFALGTKLDQGRVETDLVSLNLRGRGDERSRQRVAQEFLTLRTLLEVRSAWDAADRKDTDALRRRLGRARDLRRKLVDAGLVGGTYLAQLPDLDALEAAMQSAGGASREARRTFTSWAHNTQTSFTGPAPRRR